jgi:hypothetical protein
MFHGRWAEVPVRGARDPKECGWHKEDGQNDDRNEVERHIVKDLEPAQWHNRM